MSQACSVGATIEPSPVWCQSLYGGMCAAFTWPAVTNKIVGSWGRIDLCAVYNTCLAHRALHHEAYEEGKDDKGKGGP
jgi:hypothetical protein